MCALVNNFDEIGPASLDITAGDETPVQLSRRIFDYYLGGVRAEKEDADKICQVRTTYTSLSNDNIQFGGSELAESKCHGCVDMLYSSRD